MKRITTLLIVAAVIILGGVIAPTAQAASSTWTLNGTGDWSTAGNWNNGVPGLLGNVGTVTDAATFSGSSDYKVYLSGSRTIGAQTFANTGTTTILGGTSATAANETLYLTGGITLNSGAGAVTIGDTSGSPTRKVDIKMGSSTILNNSLNTLTFANGLGSRGTGSTTTINFDGTGNTVVSGTYGISDGATVALTKTGAGTLTLSGSITYAGATIVNKGMLTLSGNRTATAGNITVGSLTSSTSVLNIQGNLPMGGNQILLGQVGTVNATVNQTAGSLTFTSGNGLLLGNAGGAGGVNVTYNLSGGAISATSGFASQRGIMMGANAGAAGSPVNATFNLSGTGSINLNVSNGYLMLGRSDSPQSYVNATYSQTGGTATFANLTIGGQSGSGTVTANFSVTGGSFTAAAFPTLVGAASSTATITIGGTGSVQLPAFPTKTGTAYLFFNGGTLVAGASSGTYMPAGTFNLATISASGAKIDTGANDITIGQAFQGVGGLIKYGSGILTFSGANTFSGGTTITAGTLLTTTPSGLPGYSNSGSVTIKGGVLGVQVGGAGWNTGSIDALLSAATKTSGALGIDTTNGDLTQWTAFTTSNFGPLGLTKLGANTLTLTFANTYTGTTTVSGGTLKAGSSTAFNNNGTLIVNTSTATFDLNGNNATFTASTLSAGTITDSSGGTGISTLNLGAVSASIASVVKNGPTQKVAITLNNSNTGSTAFTNTGNTFSGGLTLLNNAFGTRLVVGTSANALGTGTITIGLATTDKAGIYFNGANQTMANPIVFNTANGTDVSGAIRMDNSATFTGSMNANLVNATFGTYGGGITGTLTGQITGNSGLRVLNSVYQGNNRNKTLTLVLNNAGPATDYAGNTTVDTFQILALGRPDQIPNGAGKGNVSLAGTLTMNGYSETINGLSGAGTIDGVSGSPVLTVGDNNASGTFSGVIKNTAGNLALVKIGTNTQTLSGANTYIGATLINNGTLVLGAGGSIVNSATIDVATASAYLDVSAVTFTLGSSQTLKGYGTVVGPVTAYGTVAPGNSVGTLTFSSSFTLANTGTLSLELVGNNMDKIIVGGNLTLNGTINFTDSGTHTSNAYVFAMYSGTLDTTGVTVNGVPTGYTVEWNYLGLNNQAAIVIPEPSALALVGLGLVGMLATSRWFRRRA